ncbi:flippase [Patescibacteria group bacterium]|nr:flippase [Patescibacteria group bacterium]
MLDRIIKKQIFKNTFWLGLSEGISRLAMFLLIIYVARILGPNQFGVFSFALAFCSLFLIFSHLGLSEIIIRELAEDKENEKKYPAILTLKISLSIFAYLLLFLSSFFISNEMRKIVWILGIYVLSNNFLIIIYAFFRARQKMKYEAGIKIIQSFLILGMGFILLKYIPSVETLGYVLFGSTLLTILFVLTLFSIFIMPISLSFDFAVWKNFLKLSWPLGLAVAIGVILLRINSVMMGYLGQLTEVGWYNAAYRIVGIAIIFSALMLSSFFPALSKIFKESKERAEQIYNLYREITIAIAVPLVVSGIVLSSKIILFLYGASYLPAVLAFQILIGVAGINFLYNPYSMMFVVSNKQKAILIISSITVGINIVLNIILIPRYSLYGAAIATLISYLILLFITFEISRRLNLFNLVYRNLFKTLIISIFSTMMMIGIITIPYIFSLHILLLIALGIVIYLTILFFFIQVGLLGLNLKHWLT